MNTMDLLLQSAIQFAVPLWLAGLGELVVQRAGVINIGIEGMMLGGAFAAWTATVLSGSPWLGLLFAAATGALLAGLFAIVTLVFDADQVVAGTALNLLALGATGVGWKWCIDAGLPGRAAAFFPIIDVRWIPFDALDQYGLFHVTLLLAFALHWLFGRTRVGLELIAMGEHPAAADAVGIRVNLRRAMCVLFGGVTAGLAGSYLSIMFVKQFGENITAGRGFLALALVIFGRWQPLGLIAGGLFFGAVYAVEKRVAIDSPGWMPSPAILEMAPYLLSLVVLAGFVGRTRSPSALGQPFERG